MRTNHPLLDSFAETTILGLGAALAVYEVVVIAALVAFFACEVI